MVRDISRDELKSALDKGEIPYLFDARSDEAYEKAHILGAESLPAGRVESGAGLPDDRYARIVFYCNEPT